MKYVRSIFIVLLLAVAGFFIVRFLLGQRMLEEIIARLSADTRVAEVLVTGVNYDESTHRNYTTIKFVEHHAKGQSLEPKYFTFPGRIIQFQSLVVRFDDRFVKMGDKLRGKSAYLFLKAFALNGANTKEFVITPTDEVPEGYKVAGGKNAFEEQFWDNFWRLAFDPHYAKTMGVKNVQIEAPGMMFIPGYLYTITIENDGGLRIDTKPLPAILRGEQILK